MKEESKFWQQVKKTHSKYSGLDWNLGLAMVFQICWDTTKIVVFSWLN